MSDNTGDLSVKDLMTLDFECRRWKYTGAKEAAIRELFSESPARYYQRLQRLLNHPAAIAHDPQLVRRLQRLRDERRRARGAA